MTPAVGAMDMVIAKARAAGRIVGSGVNDAEHAVQMIQRRVQCVQLGGVDQYLWQHFQEMAEIVHARLAGQPG